MGCGLFNSMGASSICSIVTVERSILNFLISSKKRLFISSRYFLAVSTVRKGSQNPVNLCNSRPKANTFLSTCVKNSLEPLFLKKS
jgi:hypothetical protein